MVVWGFLLNNITQKPALQFLQNNLAVLVRHSQAQNCLQISPNPFLEVTKFKKFYFSLMPSAKHNSTMESATGLIFSLLNIASSRDVPFCQPGQPHSKHYGSTFVLLCSSFFLQLTTQDVNQRQCEMASHWLF